MATRSKPAAPGPPLEIASGVFFLEVGRGFMRSNVYFVRSGSSWVLIDAASARCAPAIRAGAASVFGVDSAPSAILLTHSHPDHDGSARELATSWRCPVYAHPDELPIACGDVAAIERSANPLDRWLILPSLRLLGARRMQALVERSSLEGVIRPLDPHDSVPGLPDWELILTPGHTPGHVAFFRPLRQGLDHRRRPGDEGSELPPRCPFGKAAGGRTALVHHVGLEAGEAFGRVSRRSAAAGGGGRTRQAHERLRSREALARSSAAGSSRS